MKEILSLGVDFLFRNIQHEVFELLKGDSLLLFEDLMLDFNVIKHIPELFFGDYPIVVCIYLVKNFLDIVLADDLTHLNGSQQKLGIL